MRQSTLLAKEYQRIPAGELKLFIVIFIFSCVYYISVDFSPVEKRWLIISVGLVYILSVITKDSLLWPTKWIVKFINNNIRGYYYCVTAIGENYKFDFIKMGEFDLKKQPFNKTDFIRIYLPIGGWFNKPIIFFQPHNTFIYEPLVRISRLSFRYGNPECCLKDCEGSEIRCISTADIFSLLRGLYYSGQFTWRGYFLYLNSKN